MPRKMTTSIDQAAQAADWYQQMAVAMRQRDTCLNAIARWQGKLAEAEARIAEIAAQNRPADAEPPAVDPDWSDSAE
jgi:uncharacterized protein YeaC (DUF1315 family)